MSHPSNKRDRFLIGSGKAKKRFYGENNSTFLPEIWSEEKVIKWTKKGIGLRRDTTKLCSCSMCGNPRHSSKESLTMQELKEDQSIQED